MNDDSIIAIQNIGFAIMVGGLLLGCFTQWLSSWVIYAFNLFAIGFGLVMWVVGLFLQDVKERMEYWWQRD